jgi:hypothetical protein
MKPSRTTRLLGNERVVTNQAILPDFAGTTATGMKSGVAKRARYWRSGHRDATELGVTRTVTPGTTPWSPRGQRFPTAAARFGSVSLEYSLEYSLGPAAQGAQPLIFVNADGRGQPALAFVAGRNPPLASMKATMRSRPSPFFRFVITKGRSPRMRRASVSIFSRDAPT